MARLYLFFIASRLGKRGTCFETETVENLNKKQREIDSLLQKMKKLEADQSAKKK